MKYDIKIDVNSTTLDSYCGILGVKLTREELIFKYYELISELRNCLFNLELLYKENINSELNDDIELLHNEILFLDDLIFIFMIKYETFLSIEIKKIIKTMTNDKLMLYSYLNNKN